MSSDFQGEVLSSLICALFLPHTRSLNLMKHNIHLGWPDSDLASLPGHAQVLLLEWCKDILSIMEILKSKTLFSETSLNEQSDCLESFVWGEYTLRELGLSLT